MSKKQKFHFKKGVFTNNRGGTLKFLNLYCEHCKIHILLYQKDGPGHLKRLYLDRIVAPDSFVGLEELDIKDIPRLVCQNCGRLIAIPDIYKEENRKVYSLLSYTFIPKIGKGEYPVEKENL